MQIWAIVDCFTNIAHLIVLKDDAKRSSALPKIFISNIYTLYGLPSDIVLDRDRCFHALSAEVCELLDILRRIYAAYDPETDQQTDIVN
jgi:hypothetical protein